jgi:hypothetical protein
LSMSDSSAANALICNAVGRQEQLHNVATCLD